MGAPARAVPDVGDVQLDRDVLRLLVHLASLVTRSHDASSTLEAVAETARGLLGAASLSLSRREDGGTVLRTLVNVGDLSPGEARWPADEVYDLGDYPRTLAVLDASRHGVTLAHVDDPTSDPAEVALLRQLGKASCLNAPIVLDGVVWGELYAARHLGQPRFDEYSSGLSEVVVGLIAAGVAQAQSWQRLHALASTDPMTGLANRRAFDDRLAELLLGPVQAPGLALVLGDVDGLKQVNDSLGHTAGDETLVAVAEEARRAVSSVPRAMAARLGGDEYALLLPAVDDEGALGTARAWWSACADAPHGASLSVGLVVITGGTHQPTSVFRRADRALYAAKQTRAPGPVVADL